MSGVEDLADHINQSADRASRMARYLPGLVVGRLDERHVMVDIGGGRQVPAYVPRTVGFARAGQSVRVRNWENSWEIHALTGALAFETDGFTWKSGWADDGTTGWLVLSGWCVLRIGATRTGSTITASATGHLADIKVVTVPAAACPTWNGMLPGHWKTTTTSGGAKFTPTTGLVELTDLNSSSAVSGGDYIKTLFHYPLWTTG